MEKIISREAALKIAANPLLTEGSRQMLLQFAIGRAVYLPIDDLVDTLLILERAR